MAADIREQITLDTGFIYALVDPRDLQTKYIGQTTLSVQMRLEMHMSEARENSPNPKNRWLSDLKKLGLKPLTKTLLECQEECLDSEEISAISKARNSGISLLNVRNGGGGSASRRGPRKSDTEFVWLFNAMANEQYRRAFKASQIVNRCRRIKNSNREILFSGSNCGRKRAKRDLRRHKYAMRREE